MPPKLVFPVSRRFSVLTVAYIGRIIKRLDRNSSARGKALSGGALEKKNQNRSSAAKSGKDSSLRSSELKGSCNQKKLSVASAESINPVVPVNHDVSIIGNLVSQLRCDDCKTTTRSILRTKLEGHHLNMLSGLLDQANKILYEKIVLDRSKEAGLIVNVIHHLFKCGVDKGSCAVWKVLLREIKIVFLTIIYSLKGNHLKLTVIYGKQFRALNETRMHHVAHYFLKLFALTNSLLVNGRVRIMAGHVAHGEKKLVYGKSHKLSLCRRKLLKCIVETNDLDKMALYNELQLECVMDDE